MLSDPTDGGLSNLGASSTEPSSDAIQTSRVVNSKIRIPRLGTAPVAAHRQRTGRACALCHQRKTKCDGQKPQCKQCRQLGFPCTYVGSKRERQKWALESVQAKIQSYESLLQRIITESSEDPSKFKLIEELITRHFEGAPTILTPLLALGSPSDRSPFPSNHGLSLYRMLAAWMSHARSETQPLAQKPVIQITGIHRWTLLANNDTASHLLSLYFMWENPTWQLIDKDLFVRDLESGHGKFCSALLVTVLLFFGCSLSYNLDRITDRREEKLLSKKLYAEIQRLWEIEKRIESLATAQSSILIGLLCCTFGLDRFGTQYIMHGAQLCLNLGLQHEHPSYFYDDAPDEDGQLAKCHKLVSWAVYDVQGIASQVYRKVPAWKEPPSVKFSPVEAAGLDAGVEWSPYPFITPISQPFFFTAACFRSDLVTIVHHIAEFALRFPDAVMGNDDWEYGHQLHKKLLQWKATLPPVLLLEQNTTPHVICLHEYYHATIASLCQVFCANLGSTDGQIPNPEEFDPYTIVSQALDAIGSLILLFKRCHGWKSLPVVMLHYFCVAGVHSVSKLNAHEPKWRYVLEDCVVGLWHMSLGWGRLCTAFLRTIELVLKQSNPDPSLVPSRVAEILRQLNEGDLWTVTDISSLAADYVVHQVATQPESSSSPWSAYRSQGLQSLIHDMDSLSINLSSESPESLSSVKGPYDSRSSKAPDMRDAEEIIDS
ncbi:C6 transcription factor [Aspergillus bombycis]|uniref:C6 transcription factor n=1 Tax=Aspergillus bombycis TaxID=109264 RepID=A0A1F7ZKW6_9EURO|nr:C6 transcription factor [Aspergillus bombycis]OGM39685.1 C6 transcription factor [Aspergillus bombycis]